MAICIWRIGMFILLLAVTACEKRIGPEAPVRLTMQIDSKQGECSYLVGSGNCLLIRENDSERWSFMYEGIEGFTYEPGYDYTVEVWRQTLPIDGIADALPYRFVLIREIDKIKK
jgi:hypothetical protein